MKTSDQTSAPNAPTRRLDENDVALLNTSDWYENNNTEFKLEDKVSLADSKAIFLQGLVVYVGSVHFATGIHVGVQLTGPSIGRGNCDGNCRGKRYFANVGHNNGVLVPISKVNKRLAPNSGDPLSDTLLQQRKSEESRLADLEFIDSLVESRALAILKLDERKRSKGLNRFKKEETHVTRLKELRYEELMRARGIEVAKKEESSTKKKQKYAGPNSTLAPHDFELAEGLELTQQNYCVSDPSLPDNPIVYCSQPFLNMTGYDLDEIVGTNCRFLQGRGTDKYHVRRLRQSLLEGTDCHVCLLNYRKDGSRFYNRLFMTALRDSKGRIKNFIGVQTEVSKKMALQINSEEKSKFESRIKDARVATSSDTLSNGSGPEGCIKSDEWETLTVSNLSIVNSDTTGSCSKGGHTATKSGDGSKAPPLCTSDDGMTQSTAGGSGGSQATPYDYANEIEEAYLKVTGDYRFL